MLHEVFQYRKDEMLGKNVTMLMPDNIAQQHDQFLKHYLDTGLYKLIHAAHAII